MSHLRTLEPRFLVQRHVLEFGRLPDGLGPLMQRPDVRGAVFLDPVTGRSYGYRVLDSLRYELCATFDAADSTASAEVSPFWRHGPGRTCFAFAVPPRVVMEGVPGPLAAPRSRP